MPWPLAPGVQSSPLTASNVRNCHSLFGCKNIVRDGFRGLAWCSQTRLQPTEQIIKEYKMVMYNQKKKKSCSSSATRVVSHFGLAIYITNYLTTKEPLRKLKYFNHAKI